MDCSFDNVKFEKAKAMARYNRFRKISKFLQFLEVLVGLALISWSSTRLPGLLKLFGESLFEVASYVCNPHVVFLIGNAIVALLFVLRRGNENASGNESSGDLYEDYVRHSDRKVYVPDEIKSIPPVPVPVLVPVWTPEFKETNDADDGGGGKGGEEEKQIVCVHEEELKQCDAMTVAIETATKQIEKFQRTQSVKLKREIAAVKPRPAELRRSETVKVGGRRADRVGMMTPLDKVDKLSDEEFNMTIEAYIKRHQEFLKDQKLAENQEELKNAIVRKQCRCATVR